jgi:hypothetical protein
VENGKEIVVSARQSDYFVQKNDAGVGRMVLDRHQLPVARDVDAVLPMKKAKRDVW